MPKNLIISFALATFSFLAPIQILAQECACPSESSCKPCSGGYTSLTLRYDGTSPALILIFDGTKTLANLTVYPAQEFKITGSKRNEKFADKFVPVLVNGTTNTTLGSSCADVQVGFSYGSFTVVAAASMGGSIVCCTTSPPDLVSPVITDVPRAIKVEATNGCGSQVFWTEPIASDDCTIASVSATHFSGELFPIGNTMVTYSATDKSGNVGNSSFTVTVSDNTAPVFTGGPGKDVIITSSQSCGAIASWAEPEILNDCDVTITKSHAPNTMFSLGTTRVQYEAKDASGNASTFSFNVIVTDVTAPQFTGGPQTDITLPANESCSAIASWTDPVVTGECDATIIRSHDPNSSFNLGTTKVQYEARDGSGNISYFSFNVIVSDDEPPTFTSFPYDQTITLGETNCSAQVSWRSPEVSDGCSGVTLTSSHQSGTEFPVGVTQVTFSAIDESGNKSEKHLTITVEDKRALVISNCPNDIHLTADEDELTKVSWLVPVATAKCEVIDLTSSYNPGDLFRIGNTVVEYTARTQSGKSAYCSFDVTIVERQHPLQVSRLVTPDGDGLNDEWIILNIEDYRDIQVMIVDRWGGIIFQASRYDNESAVWKGTNKAGVSAPTGTYFYTIVASTGKQRVKETGSIELVR